LGQRASLAAADPLRPTPGIGLQVMPLERGSYGMLAYRRDGVKHDDGECGNRRWCRPEYQAANS
jgi:hypothetical protein